MWSIQKLLSFLIFHNHALKEYKRILSRRHWPWQQEKKHRKRLWCQQSESKKCSYIVNDPGKPSQNRLEDAHVKTLNKPKGRVKKESFLCCCIWSINNTQQQKSQNTMPNKKLKELFQCSWQTKTNIALCQKTIFLKNSLSENIPSIFFHLRQRKTE